MAPSKSNALRSLAAVPWKRPNIGSRVNREVHARISGGFELPCSIIAEHSVEGCDHFSHDGDDDDLGFLVGTGETIGEGLEGGTVTAFRVVLTGTAWPMVNTLRLPS